MPIMSTHWLGWRLIGNLLESSSGLCAYDTARKNTILQFCKSFVLQLLLKSKTRYFSRGSIIADSREDAHGLVVITAGQVEMLPYFTTVEC
jgi:hypothetical protein